MKRISILFALLLASVVVACSSDQGSPSADPSVPATTEATPEPTPEATPEDSDDASAAPSFSFGGTDSALLDLLPDTLDGNARTDVDLTDFPAFTAALEGQGMSADDVEYVISTWGTGDDVVTATAMRIPGIDRPGLEQMARMMTGAAQGEGEAEVVTLGGKEVLAISAVNQGQTGYMYFVGDGVFIIGSSSEDSVAELLSQLP